MRKILNLICALCLFALTASARVPGTPGTNYLWLDYWDFADTTNWTTFLGFPPISFTNITSSPLPNGTALVVDSTNSSWLSYNVFETNGWTNLSISQGSFMGWFAPNWSSTNSGGSGPGTWGRIIDAGSYTTNASVGWLGLYFDPAGANIYFSAQTNSGSTTNYFVAPISFTNSQWHLLALTYSSTNTAFYFDGQLVTNGPGMTVWPGTNALINGFYIGSDETGTAQAHGLFSAVSTYCNVLDSNTIYSEFVLSSIFYNSGVPDVLTISSAPSTPVFSPNFLAITGSGYLTAISTNTTNCLTSSNLWITNVAAWKTNNGTMAMGFTISGGSNGIAYDVFATTYLTGTNPGASQWAWMGQGSQCVTYVLTNLPANSPCFLILGTPQDSDMDGLTDAYELLVSKTNPNDPNTSGDGMNDGWDVAFGFDPNSFDTGNTGVGNGYRLCPIGDGLTYLDAFYLGINPNIWQTPSAPLGFTAQFTPSSGVVSLKWQPCRGAVTNYTLVRTDNIDGIVTPMYYSVGLTNNFVDHNYPASGGSGIVVNPSFYEVQANYTLGDSSWSPGLWPNPTPTVEASTYLLDGPNGTVIIALANANAVTNGYTLGGGSALMLSFQYDDGFLDWYITTNVNVPISAFTNGLYTLPSNLAALARTNLIFVQEYFTNGQTNSARSLDTAGSMFFDGRVQLQETVNFLLRAGNESYPFDYSLDGTSIYQPTNYTYAGFRYAYAEFMENYHYRNFVFAVTNLDSYGYLTTGAQGDTTLSFGLQTPLKYDFTPSTNISFVPDQLPTNQTRWMLPYGYQAGVNFIITNGNLILPQNIVNTVGLPLLSVMMVNNSNGILVTNLVLAGGSTTAPASPATLPYVYPEFAQPAFTTSGYYLSRRGGGGGMAWSGITDLSPGDVDFSPAVATNAQPPLLFASVGVKAYFNCFSTKALQNGNAGEVAYVQQYFDSAITTDTNGVSQTNTTGVLSPFGTFFPTEPGKVTITTMPDIYNGNYQAQLPIYAIGLFADANHDGVIDQTFGGPDFSSPLAPFQFWVNDDNDSGDTDGNDIPGWPARYNQIPNGLSGEVNGVRDLVDFFPVYLGIRSFLNDLSTNDISTYQFILRDTDDGALNFVYTSLTPDQPLQYLTDTNLAIPLVNSSIYPLTFAGVHLLNSFLFGLKDSNQGIILVEATRPTGSPLILEIWKDGVQIAETELSLNITGVEQMFRHKNLIWATTPNQPDGPPDRLADTDVPNEPPTNDKNLVFLHGYNVNPDQARGWFAEMYKRFYWSGSHAKFYGCTYRGYDGQKKVGSQTVTMNLQTNIVHAFETAPQLATFLNGLNGTNILAAHSLGNMVVLSALSDYTNTAINSFFMIDAAVAMEAIDGSVGVNTNMVHSEWAPYTNTLWASDWYQLFPTNDYRSQLTWRNRLSNLGAAQVYNFYSSGEEVLRTFPDTPPSLSWAVSETLVYVAGSILWPSASGLIPGTYTWAWQEKLKGRCPWDFIIGSSHGGWKFNDVYYDPFDGGRPTPSTADSFSPSQLKSHPFFDLTSVNFGSADSIMQGLGLSDPSSYAQTNRNRILSDAIPCLSLPVGANHVARLAPDGGPDRNFNMQSAFENGWSPSRMQLAEANNWHHSDVHEMAYTYIYLLFNKIVTSGNLK